MDKRLKSMLAIAADAPCAVRNYRLAAGIYVKNRLISIGYPALKTHPLQARYTHAPLHKLYVHAEVSAISKAISRFRALDLSKTTLVVARAAYVSDKPDSLSRSANAMPCQGCFAAIEAFKVGNVIWTEDNFTASNFFI